MNFTAFHRWKFYKCLHLLHSVYFKIIINATQAKGTNDSISALNYVQHSFRLQFYSQFLKPLKKVAANYKQKLNLYFLFKIMLVFCQKAVFFK